MHYNPVGSRNSLAGTTSFGLCRQQWQAGPGWKDHQDYKSFDLSVVAHPPLAADCQVIGHRTDAVDAIPHDLVHAQ